MIMDGNQRWAKKNNKSLKEGYVNGLYHIKEIVKICIEKKIKFLTLYALSSENIKRNSIDTIFYILSKEYQNFINDKYFINNVKVKIIGEKQNLPKKTKIILSEIENKTKNNYSINLNIAFNYGTDKEIVEVIKKITKLSLKQKITINKKLIKEKLYLGHIPDPDLLIRTGGFQRLSNFLLLNLSYTELFFVKTLWPDFNRQELFKIFNKYKNIERKYGL